MLAAGTGAAVQRSVRRFNWRTVMPVWTLRLGADGQSDWASSVREELDRRLNADLLSKPLVDDLVEHALARQADPNDPWNGTRASFNSSWGAFIEDAWSKGLLNQARIDRYLRVGFGSSFTVKSRAKARQGKPIPIEIRTGPARFSGRPLVVLPDTAFLSVQAKCLDIQGAAFEGGSDPDSIMIGSSSLAGSSTTRMAACSLAPGHHQLKLRFAFTVNRNVFRMRQDGLGGQEMETTFVAISRWEQDCAVDIEIVPPEQEVVARVADESLKQTIRDAMRIEMIENSVNIGAPMHGSMCGRVLFSPVPVDLSFYVLARRGGATELIGQITVARNLPSIENAQRIDHNPREFFPDADEVDLVFRTNPRIAERTAGITEVWDGEIVVEHVKIRKPPNQDG